MPSHGSERGGGREAAVTMRGAVAARRAAAREAGARSRVHSTTTLHVHCYSLPRLVAVSTWNAHYSLLACGSSMRQRRNTLGKACGEAWQSAESWRRAVRSLAHRQLRERW